MILKILETAKKLKIDMLAYIYVTISIEETHKMERKILKTLLGWNDNQDKMLLNH